MRQAHLFLNEYQRRRGQSSLLRHIYVTPEFNRRITTVEFFRQNLGSVETTG
jgi:hypothetical protein